MTTSDHILIVDDDTEIRDLLRQYLLRHGFRVTSVGDSSAMEQVMEGSRVDLIVLDLMLPGEDGMSICRRLRASSSIPVIMLTARGEDADRIAGLETGADDYLPKPFNPHELLARIKSVLRRARALPDTLQPEEARCFSFCGWQLDTVTRQLLSPDSVVVPLSGAEYRLLHAFLLHPNVVLNRDQLVEMVRGRQNNIPFDRSMDVQVSRLRQRLQDDGRDKTIIRTVRGAGYVFSQAVEIVS